MQMYTYILDVRVHRVRHGLVQERANFIVVVGQGRREGRAKGTKKDSQVGLGNLFNAFALNKTSTK